MVRLHLSFRPGCDDGVTVAGCEDDVTVAVCDDGVTVSG